MVLAPTMSANWIEVNLFNTDFNIRLMNLARGELRVGTEWEKPSLTREQPGYQSRHLAQIFRRKK